MLSFIRFGYSVKPFFLSTPANQTILTDQTAEFACRVGGDPSPEILWRRNDGKMPIGRAHILDDKSLRIEKVTSQDQGTYICDADNAVGAISASATLTVHCEYTDRNGDRISGEARSAVSTVDGTGASLTRFFLLFLIQQGQSSPTFQKTRQSTWDRTSRFLAPRAGHRNLPSFGPAKDLKS